MRKLTTLALCTLFVATAAVAQEAKKPLSPAAKAQATVKGKKITVDYSAPSKRGRAIMGELVPYGKVWRTGANAATTLATEADLMIGSLHVPAGKYTLYTIPGEKEWTLIVNKQTGQWGSNYDEAQDLGRVKLTVAPQKEPVETFTIGVGDTISFAWDNTKAWAPIVVH
jgi:hypothetical protein